MAKYRNKLPQLLALLIGALLATTGIGCSSGTGPGDGSVVVLAFDGRPEDTMRVLVTNQPAIQAARDYLTGLSQAHIPAGPIVRGAGIDPQYPFHFISDSVRFVEAAIELCDGAPMKTPEEVDDFIENSTGDRSSPSAQWCPWGARPVAVEPNGID